MAYFLNKMHKKKKKKNRTEVTFQESVVSSTCFQMDMILVTDFTCMTQLEKNCYHFLNNYMHSNQKLFAPLLSKKEKLLDL